MNQKELLKIHLGWGEGDSDFESSSASDQSIDSFLEKFRPPPVHIKYKNVGIILNQNSVHETNHKGELKIKEVRNSVAGKESQQAKSSTPSSQDKNDENLRFFKIKDSSKENKLNTTRHVYKKHRRLEIGQATATNNPNTIRKAENSYSDTYKRQLKNTNTAASKPANLNYYNSSYDTSNVKSNINNIDNNRLDQDKSDKYRYSPKAVDTNINSMVYGTTYCLNTNFNFPPEKNNSNINNQTCKTKSFSNPKNCTLIANDVEPDKDRRNYSKLFIDENITHVTTSKKEISSQTAFKSKIPSLCLPRKTNTRHNIQKDSNQEIVKTSDFYKCTKFQQGSTNSNNLFYEENKNSQPKKNLLHLADNSAVKQINLNSKICVNISTKEIKNKKPGYKNQILKSNKKLSSTADKPIFVIDPIPCQTGTPELTHFSGSVSPTLEATEFLSEKEINEFFRRR